MNIKKHPLPPWQLIFEFLFNFLTFPIVYANKVLLYSVKIIIIISMSLYYKVDGAQRCQKLKNRLGLKIKPVTKSKEPYYSPGDKVIYECETNGHKQTIKCLETGSWSEIPPCEDPSNSTCPDLQPMEHGFLNATGPYKVNTIVAFKCQNELPELTYNSNTSFRRAKDLKEDANSLSDGQKYTFPTTLNANFNELDANPITLTTTTTSTTAATSQQQAHTTSTLTPLELAQPILNVSNRSTLNNTLIGSFENPISSSSIKYNLTGHRILRCLPSSKWSHEQPKCVPITPTSESNSSLILTSAIIILIPIFIFFLIAQLFMRWRKRQQQRERWKQYFTDYKYRHSKTSITFGTRPNQNSSPSNRTIPVTDL